MNLKKLWPHLAMLLILYVCCNNYYGDIIDKLPFGYHDWAQSDRLALAVNFYDNGMDFFHPATQNLNSKEGIVGVEFPIQAYVAAGIAHLSGRDSISTVFRLLDILIAVTGLYFLFRAVFNATRDFAFSMFMPVFIFASPVYAFYSGNYLPDPAAASICFIAFYCLLEAIRLSRFQLLIAAILLATLATLIKASTASCLLGIVCFGLYQTAFKVRNRKQLLYILLTAGLCAALILGNIAYIRYLNKKYDSYLFLSQIRPFESGKEFVYFIENYFKNFLVHEYLMQAQYPILFLLLGFGGYALARHRSLRPYGWPIPILLLSAIGIFWLFSKQYEVHDYYFISTFLPVIAYCGIVSVIGIHRELFEGTNLKGMRAGLACAAVITFFFADYQTSLRMHMEQYFDQDYAFRWMPNGKALLEALKIPANEKIVVADSEPPNLGLIYFDRKGYNIPKDWNAEAEGIRKFMDERNVRTVVMKSDRLNAIRTKDSTLVDSFFVLLANTEGKAVLQRKKPQ